MTLALTPSASGALPYTLTPSLTRTTLLYSSTPLPYGAVASANNSADKFHFNGRSDNFAAGNSLNGNNARLDREALVTHSSLPSIKRACARAASLMSQLNGSFFKLTLMMRLSRASITW